MYLIALALLLLQTHHTTILTVNTISIALLAVRAQYLNIFEYLFIYYGFDS